MTARAGTWAALLLSLVAAGGAVLVLLPPSEEAVEGTGAVGTTEESRATPVLIGVEPEVATAKTEGKFRVRGRVEDPEGGPVAGVRVAARRTGEGSGRTDDPDTWARAPDAAIRAALDAILAPRREPARPDAEGTSDAEGRFEIALAVGGSFSIRAEPDPPRLGSSGWAFVSASAPTAEVTLRVETGTPLDGRVLDSGDRGVDAVLTATRESAPVGWLSAGPVPSSAPDGRFRFPALPPGRWNLSVTLPGRMTIRAGPVDLPHDGLFTVRIDGASGALRGTVSDREGAPIAGAELLVRVQGADADGLTGAALVARSGPDGTWRAEGAPPGAVSEVSARRDGYSVYAASPPLAEWSGAAVTAGGETVIDIVLPPATALEGTVREAGSGTPLPGVLVTAVMPQSPSRYEAPRGIRTDTAGRYRIEGLAPGRYLLLAESPTHYLPSLQRAASAMGTPGGSIPPSDLLLVVSGEETVARRDLELARGLRVRGRILDAAGAPVEGASVHGHDSGAQGLWQWGFSAPILGGSLATSDRDGRFEVPGLPPRDDCVLFAAKEGTCPVPSEPFRLAAGEATPEVVLRLAPGATIRGRVLDERGAPLAGVQVNAWSPSRMFAAGRASAISDASGRFELTGIESGSVTLGAWKEGAVHSQTQVADITPGEVREGVEIRVSVGVRISGRLVDDQGVGVPRMSLMLQSESGGGGTSVQTKADGAFSAVGLTAGRVAVYPMDEEGNYWPEAPLGRFEAPAEGLTIVYRPPVRAVVQGTILDEAGRPVPLAQVSVRSVARDPRMTGIMRAEMPGQGDESNGRFRRVVRGAPPFEVEVTRPRDERGRPLNLLPATVKVEDPTQGPVEVRLSAGAEVSGRVVDSRGGGVADAMVSCGGVIEATAADGSFVLPGLPDGEAVVEVQPPGRYARPAPVRVRAGGSVVIEVSAALAIGGSVLDEGGRPVSNGWVQVEWAAAGSSPRGQASANLSLGRFRVEGVPEGVEATVTVQVWSASGAQTPQVVRRGVRAGTIDLELRVEPGVSIEGTVEDEQGQPFSACHVWANGPDGRGGGGVRPKPDGSFLLQGLRAGVAHSLSLGRDDGGATPAPVTVTPPARGVRLRLPAVAPILGRLEGAEDPASFRVFAILPSQPRGRTIPVTPGPDGRFSLGAAEGTKVRVAARRDGDRRYALTDPVPAGTTGLVLTLMEGLSLEGEVRDPSGSAAEAGWVSAQGGDWSASSPIAAGGRFEFLGLPPGHYRILARSGDGTRSGTAEAEAGDRSVRITLAPR